MLSIAVVKRLHPRHVFRISRARRPFVENVFFSVEEKGVTGQGEASPNSFYGERAQDVQLRLWELTDFFRGLRIRDRSDIEAAWDRIWEKVKPSRAALCAADLALWDFLARREGVTVSELAFGKKARGMTSFTTLGMSSEEEWPQKWAEVKGCRALKVKTGGSDPLLARLEALRKESDAVLCIDANGALTPARLAEFAALWRPWRVEFIEQPFPPSQDAEVAVAAKTSPIPLFADESCVEEEDLDHLPAGFAGFNIKLVKCGGLTPALRMARKGRERGLRVMVGCMLESSLLIAAGLVAAQAADYADLDGAWLLSDDPYTGLTWKEGFLEPGEGPGFGVRPR